MENKAKAVVFREEYITDEQVLENTLLEIVSDNRNIVLQFGVGTQDNDFFITGNVLKAMRFIRAFCEDGTVYVRHTKKE